MARTFEFVLQFVVCHGDSVTKPDYYYYYYYYYVRTYDGEMDVWGVLEGQKAQ